MISRAKRIVTMAGTAGALALCGAAGGQAGRAVNIAATGRSASAQALPEWACGEDFNHVPVARGEKVIALTFDDGPNGRYTRQVLEILRKHEAKATFFVLGSELKSSPELGRAILEDGHAIGNHSWSHPARPRNPVEEVDRTDSLIRSTLGIETTLFRPPYGIMKNGLAHEARQRREAVLLWSVDTNDWKKPGATRIANRVLNGAHPGAVVLMHDGGGDRRQTVAALPTILETLSKRGYRFVTVPELLAMRHIEEEPPQRIAARLLRRLPFVSASLPSRLTRLR